MDMIRGSSLLPPRLNKLFAETKLSYERNLNVTQIPSGSLELSPLHLKLRVQKDRLLAWGLEWSDANATQAVDLDVSLNRAGISDLVASIMSSIRELLDEAEGLQSPVALTTPAAFSDTKPGTISPYCSPWTPESLKRLECILKELTISIDTLCDLSRPGIEDRKKSDFHLIGESIHSSSHSSPAPSEVLSAGNIISSQSTNSEGMSWLCPDDGLMRSSQIDHARYIRHTRTKHGPPNTLPPSYESVATGSEHSVLAYQVPSDITGKAESLVNLRPILLDYGQIQGHKRKVTLKPDSGRYKELSLALRKLSTVSGAYSGILQLGGWTFDRDRAQCAYVYNLPNELGTFRDREPNVQPRTLLSFLQNGADTDGANMPSLENRYRLAHNLASSVLRLHSAGTTHRDINSNNVVFFLGSTYSDSNDKPWKGPIIRKPYVTGFHQSSSRVATVESGSPFESMYHHPDIGDPYIRAHDYYSLGLILLEIGLWMPLGKFWKAKYTRSDFKLRLQNIYLKKLSAKCGSRYMRAALYCMTAADSIRNGDTYAEESQLQARHGFPTETSFTLKVVRTLDRCCMIDDNDEDVDAFPAYTSPTKVNITGQTGMETSSSYGLPRTQSSERPPQIPEILRAKPEEAIPERKSKYGTLKQAPSRTCKIKVWSHEIPPLYTKYWTSTMFPKLEIILSRAISRWETYTIDIFMAGQEPDSARPTIYLECTSTDKVRKILRHLNKDLRLFDIKVVSGHVVRSKAGKKKRKRLMKNTQTGKSDVEGQGLENNSDSQQLNPFYQKLPSCGASIGACNNGKHLPPVTFGGAVLVNGEPYGMSVHHMLEDYDEIDLGLYETNPLTRSGASPKAPCNLQDPQTYRSTTVQTRAESHHPAIEAYSEDGTDDSSEDCDASEYSTTFATDDQGLQAFYPFEISDDEEEIVQNLTDDDEFWLSVDFESQLQLGRGEKEDDDHAELGDTLGISAGRGLHLSVTQPAIDDVNHGFFATDQDKHEEHLSSHGFGHIHASSGIKRSRQDDIIHEIDWALIKISETRMLTHNVVQDGARYCRSARTKDSASTYPSKAEPAAAPNSNSYPCQVMKAKDLGGLQVHAFGRTSGLQTGMILPAMRMVRMPGRSFASHSWHVRGNFGGKLHHALFDVLSHYTLPDFRLLITAAKITYPHDIFSRLYARANMLSNRRR